MCCLSCCLSVDVRTARDWSQWSRCTAQAQGRLSYRGGATAGKRETNRSLLLRLLYNVLSPWSSKILLPYVHCVAQWLLRWHERGGYDNDSAVVIRRIIDVHILSSWFAMAGCNHHSSPVNRYLRIICGMPSLSPIIRGRLCCLYRGRSAGPGAAQAVRGRPAGTQHAMCADQALTTHEPLKTSIKQWI